jgi:hypothetical protein
LNLLQEPDGGQLRIRGEPCFDDRFVRVQFGSDRPSRPVAHGLTVEIPIALARANPAMNRVAMDAKLARQRALARPLLQVVPK